MRYLIAGAPAAIGAITRQLTTAVRGARVVPLDRSHPRQPVSLAGQLRLSTRHRALRTDDVECSVRQLLGALTTASAHTQSTAVLQLVLGPRRIPLAIPNTSPSSIVRPWYEVAWAGNGGTVDPEKRTALRQKVASHGFAAIVRLGTAGDTPQQANAGMRALAAAIRTLEAPGLQVRVQPERPQRLNQASTPSVRLGAIGWPLRLNVAEAVLLSAWPIGDDELPGLQSLRPRTLAPSRLARAGDRAIAAANAPGVVGALGYGIDDAMRHTWLLGPTGTGKSTLLLNLIVQDLAAGRAVVVVEPNDLVADVLSRIPVGRRDDVVVLDPTDEQPVGINPLERHGRRPEVVADGLLATFQLLYGSGGSARGEALGPRSTDILANCLQVLAAHGKDGDTSLLMLPLLLTNPGFRRSLTARVIAADPVAAGPFWSWFESLSDEARSQVVAPLMNKLRPLLRPGLRGVLGQRHPRFNIRDVFTKNKVLLVPLQKGVIGPDTAGLLGSLVVAELWLALRERRTVPERQRRPVMLYIDEVQDYLKLPGDLADALATSRSLRAGWHLAHQYTGQLSPAMLAAFESNARSRVCFQLSARDARLMSAGQSLVTAEDFTALPAFQIYASLVQDGTVTPWASGTTPPKPAVSSDPDGIRQRSRQRYGQPLDAIEADFADLLSHPTNDRGSTGEQRPTGRRRRTT